MKTKAICHLPTTHLSSLMPEQLLCSISLINKKMRAKDSWSFVYWSVWCLLGEKLSIQNTYRHIHKHTLWLQSFVSGQKQSTAGQIWAAIYQAGESCFKFLLGRSILEDTIWKVKDEVLKRLRLQVMTVKCCARQTEHLLYSLEREIED